LRKKEEFEPQRHRDTEKTRELEIREPVAKGNVLNAREDPNNQVFAVLSLLFSVPLWFKLRVT